MTWPSAFDEFKPDFAVAKCLGKSRRGEQFPNFHIQHKHHEGVDLEKMRYPRDRRRAPDRFEQVHEQAD